MAILSTKYLDEETGLYNYGFRYYSPMLGRWLNRDPVGERGGKNLYVICHNNTLSKIDKRGLEGENTCSVASAKLNGTLGDISNTGGFPGKYLEDLNVGIILVAAGENGLGNPNKATPAGDDSTLTLPDGIYEGSRWFPMRDDVKSGAPCRVLNKCKGTCKNSCCSWDLKWDADYLYGTVQSDLASEERGEEGKIERTWSGAKCKIAAGQYAAGRRRCEATKPSCN